MKETRGEGVVFLSPPDADSPGEAALDGLREGAALALERGLAFVEAHGDPLSRLRTYVLLEAQPTRDLVDALAPRQHADGSFPPVGLREAGALGFAALAGQLPEGVEGSLEVLAVLADARSLHQALVEPMAVYLEGAQLEDGSWGLDVGGPPEQRLFATGMIAGFLGRTTVVRPRVLQRAGDFLETLWAPERVEAGHWPERTAFAQFFTNVDHDLADEALQWCGREVERAFRLRSSDTLETLRVLLYCDAQALPGATLDIEELVEGLLAEQGGDGGFAELSGAPPAQRVAPTVDAMQGLIRLCRALPPA